MPTASLVQAEFELPATLEQNLSIMVNDVIHDEAYNYNRELWPQSNASNREEELNNDEEEVLPILVPFGEGLQNGPSDTPLTAASIAATKVEELKEYLNARNLVIQLIKQVFIVWLGLAVENGMEAV